MCSKNLRALNTQLSAQLALTTNALATWVHIPARSLSPAPQKQSRPETDDRDNLEPLPAAPKQLDPDDYPLVKFWTLSSWNQYKKHQLNQGSTPSNLGFLCDEDGDRVTKERLDTITKRAKGLWNNLYWHHRDPKTWGKKCDFVADYFSQNICLLFSEFGLCEDNWKAEAFASIRYPDWTSKTRASGLLLCQFYLFTSLPTLAIH
jgi:hypothetical protein